ncbi:MAG: filamentous hemagglutinin N-terminal domain-containing protein [Nodosilinea sp.]
MALSNQNNIAKVVLQLLRIASASIPAWALVASTEVNAQSNIVPDATLGNEQSGVVSLDEAGLLIDVIDGGAIRGNNLFHSFLEFNILENRGAYFRIPVDGIDHVFSRVTGDSSSEILGTLGSFNAAGVTAAPAFYLINPSGILFGPNASLDLPASFLSTTADAIELGANGLFSATQPASSRLLSIDPSALLFGDSSPATITNQAFLGLPAAGFLINGPISFPRETLPDGGVLPFQWGLQVVDGATIGLVGGDILLEGTVTALGGRVEVASPQAGRIGLATQPSSFSLTIPDNTPLGNIEFDNGNINASGFGGGSVQIQAAQIFTGENNSSSTIFVNTQGALNGQGIVVRSTDFLRLDEAAIIAGASPEASGNGGSITVESPAVSISGGNSSISTRNFGTGRAGDITILTDRLETQTGAEVLTSTLGSGAGGNLTIVATDSVELSGFTVFEGEEEPGGLSADIQGSGTGGLLTVRTGRLTLQDGANVSARTNFGPGGSILIEAEDIELLGGSIQTQTFGSGNAGDITLRGQRLLITDGNEITASAGFRTQGNAGNIDVIASESIEITGIGGLTTAVIGGGGDGGNISVQTGELALENGGTVSAQAITLGRGGRITIAANRITVDGREDGFASLPSQISTTTFSESGQPPGDLTISTRELLVRNGGEISVDTLGNNPAGRLAIVATDAIELTGTFLGESGVIEPSRISASTSRFRGGAGGNIEISTQNFTIADGAEVSVSSLGTGPAGDLSINASSLQLLNQGRIIGTSTSGNGGNLNLQFADLLLLRGNSEISTSAGTAQTFGDGGNISISTPFIVAVPVENSDITANAFSGRGGSVDIAARGIFGLEFRPETTSLSDITASSEFGASGVVNLTTLDTSFIENDSAEVPQTPLSTEQLLTGSCIARANDDQGTFVITGSGGLPAKPGDAVVSTYPTSDVQPLSNPEPRAVWQPGDPIVEPTGVFNLGDGRVVLARECD